MIYQKGIIRLALLSALGCLSTSCSAEQPPSAQPASSQSVIDAAPPASSPPPTFAENAICRPDFIVDGQILDAGTGFLVQAKPGGATLLLSADHLFGPDGGLPEQIPWSELSKHVSGVKCTALVGGKVWRAGPALTIPGAHPISDDPVQDISAFSVTSPGMADKVVPLKLAAQAPRRGDSVWLIAQVLEGAPPTQLIHHAVVRYVADDIIQYTFDNAGLSIQATSGAPVVNDAGEVVGINLAGGLDKGKFIGTATSLTMIRKSLESAR